MRQESERHRDCERRQPGQAELAQQEVAQRAHGSEDERVDDVVAERVHPEDVVEEGLVRRLDGTGPQVVSEVELP